MPGKSINDFGMRFEFLQSNLLGDPTTFLTQSMNPIYQSIDPSTITDTVISTVTHTTTEQDVGSTQTITETRTENSPVTVIPMIIAVVILGVFRYRKKNNR